MASDLDKRIQERAYEIWESEGRPEGRQEEHWQQARTEFAEAKAESNAGKRGRTGAKAPVKGARASAKAEKPGTDPAKAKVATGTRKRGKGQELG